MMPIDLLSAVAWLVALSSGMMAGVYLAFSSFIMKAFAGLGTEAGIDAMNAINRDILRSLFMPLFFGSTLFSIVLMVLGFWQWQDDRSLAAVAAGVIYVLGMFGVTAAGNVPLNNRLAEVGAEGELAAQVWSMYLTRWTRWNSVRTVASIVCMILSIYVV